MTKTRYTPSPSEVIDNECRTLAAIAGVSPDVVRRYVNGYAAEFNTTQRSAVDNLNVCLAFSVPIQWDRYGSN